MVVCQGRGTVAINTSSPARGPGGRAQAQEWGSSPTPRPASESQVKSRVTHPTWIPAGGPRMEGDHQLKPRGETTRRFRYLMGSVRQQTGPVPAPSRSFALQCRRIRKRKPAPICLALLFDTARDGGRIASPDYEPRLSARVGGAPVQGAAVDGALVVPAAMPQRHARHRGPEVPHRLHIVHGLGSAVEGDGARAPPPLPREGGSRGMTPRVFEKGRV